MRVFKWLPYEGIAFQLRYLCPYSCIWWLAILLFQTVTHEYKEEEFITLDWVKLPPEKRTVKPEIIKRPQPRAATPKTLNIQRNRVDPNPKPVEVKVASRDSLEFVREDFDISVDTP